MQEVSPERLLKLMTIMPPPKSVKELRRRIEHISELFNRNLPSIASIHKVQIIRNAKSKSLSEPSLKCDIYVPFSKHKKYEAYKPIIRARHSRPSENILHPILLYLHGGGWVAGSPKTHRKLAMEFASCGYLTVSLDYRLAPEYPFRAALDDCLYALSWIKENALSYGGDTKRIAIGGDSAGANLAAATLIANDEIEVKAAILLYGLFDVKDAIDRIPDEGGILSRCSINLMLESYLGKNFEDDSIAKNPEVSPIHGVSEKFPPSLIMAGKLDPLYCQSERFADLCQKHGVEHELHLVENVPHGFLQMDMFPGYRDSLTAIIKFLDKFLMIANRSKR